MKWKIKIHNNNEVLKNQNEEQLYNFLHYNVKFQNGLKTADIIYKQANNMHVGKSITCGQFKLTRTQ